MAAWWREEEYALGFGSLATLPNRQATRYGVMPKRQPQRIVPRNPWTRLEDMLILAGCDVPGRRRVKVAARRKELASLHGAGLAGKKEEARAALTRLGVIPGGRKNGQARARSSTR